MRYGDYCSYYGIWSVTSVELMRLACSGALGPCVQYIRGVKGLYIAVCFTSTSIFALTRVIFSLAFEQFRLQFDFTLRASRFYYLECHYWCHPPVAVHSTPHPYSVCVHNGGCTGDKHGWGDGGGGVRSGGIRRHHCTACCCPSNVPRLFIYRQPCLKQPIAFWRMISRDIYLTANFSAIKFHQQRNFLLVMKFGHFF